jgi:hypothetical protein
VALLIAAAVMWLIFMSLSQFFAHRPSSSLFSFTAVVTIALWVGIITCVILSAWAFRCPRCGKFINPTRTALWSFPNFCGNCGLDFLCRELTRASNHAMKPTAPLQKNLSVFVTNAARGLSLSR